MARRKKQNEDPSPENTDNINNESDDSFGLPEVEYEPLKRDEPQSSTSGESSYEEVIDEPVNEEVAQEEEVYEEPQYKPMYEEEDEPSILPKVIIIILLLGIAGAGVWYFGFERPKKQEMERLAKQEELAKAERDRKAAEERAAEQKRLEDEQRRADSLANAKPKVGIIESLTERTRRYYVVVSSAIDDDLVMDYAKKLSKEGVNCTIIPPFGKTKFSRLAVDVKDSFADAQAAADALKGGDFGNEIWVVKY